MSHQDSRAVRAGVDNGLGGDTLDGDGVHGQDFIDNAADFTEQHGVPPPHRYRVEVRLLV